MGINSLFALKKPAPAELQVQQKEITPPSMDYANPDAILSGETYNHYGVRMCGRVNGDTAYLPPFLQRVFFNEKEKQRKDEALQDAARQGILHDISDKQAELEKATNHISEIEDRIQTCRDRIDEWRGEIAKMRNQIAGGRNKEAKIKMILGCVILIPLTFYLFVFYSSTFYSAFFRNFAKGNIGIGNAMLDPQAIPAAYNEGVGELFFVLTAPVIFLGLGFALHFFTQQRNKMKYLKMGAIISVTFLFDCILAYLIGKKIHDVQLIFTDLPPYNLREAIGDPNIWAIIFCGFVVYIIWGIVFDMAMTAYNEFSSNRSHIERYETLIENERQSIGQFQIERSQANTMKIDISHKIEKLQQDLSSSIVHYNLGAIRDCLSQFFTGWMSVMESFNPGKAEVANKIYRETIESFNLSDKVEE